MFTADQLAYLIKCCGGPLDMQTRSLDNGLTAEGVIELRAKLEAMMPERSNRACNPSVEGDG